MLEFWMDGCNDALQEQPTGMTLPSCITPTLHHSVHLGQVVSSNLVMDLAGNIKVKQAPFPSSESKWTEPP
jgi:hypothetical protein